MIFKDLILSRTGSFWVSKGDDGNLGATWVTLKIDSL